jgi:serine/threonine protein kinase/DNA-binding response OmpR family regulator
LLAGLKGSALLSAEDLDRAAKVASDHGPDGRPLARWLVSSGLLTNYQLEAICTRNSDELRIGNYEVLDRLGAGGMGTVFKARHRRMKRVVALKVLSRALADDEHFVHRFQREVETIARLSHPNIVMAFDADEAQVGHFLVMEFVDGRDLASLVQKGGPLSVSQAVECLLQAARGLDYAHTQGIIHRDVKPDNLLLDVNGVVKVADLGLARVHAPANPATEPSSVITQVGGILGTVNYMAPEQAVDSTAIDHLADVYSLGATLHYLVTGLPPYTAQSAMAILLKHRDAPIPSLTAVRDDIPVALDSLFRKMVAKAPADRVKSMAAVVAELEAIRSGLSLGPGDALAELLRPGRKATLPSPAPARVEPRVGDSSSRGISDQTVDFRAPPAPRLKPLKVVLVEPSRTQAGIIRTYLQNGGIFTVVVVGSGEEALRLVREDCPDALVSALHLADMTGVELAHRVGGTGKSGAPGFVLISSEADSHEAEALGKSDRAILLRKPFTPDGLLGALRAVLGAAAPPPAATSRRAKFLVLLVDDSSAARLHARKVLEGLGFAKFVEAVDGAAAVAAVARDKFDLIVTDYNMPFMDGHGLIGYLKQNPVTANIPVIMVTTEGDPAKLEAVRRLGVTAVCDKSFQPEAVRGIVDQLVGLS